MLAKQETAAPTTCPRCGGSGWVVDPDEGVGSARRCGCHKEEMGPRLLAAAGIPRRYRGCRLSNFETRHPKPEIHGQLRQALADCHQYVEHFVREEGGFRDTGLLFAGPPGVGKTHLAAAVLVELVERYRVRGRFVEFTSLVHQIQATFDPDAPGSKHEVLDPIAGAEVLVLDELGAQNPTPWVQDVLYLLVNTRYTRRLPTLFTTNYRLEQPPAAAKRAEPLDRGPDPDPDPLAKDRYGLLAERLPPMLISRLFEMAKPVRLGAVSDYRRDIRMYQHRQ